MQSVFSACKAMVTQLESLRHQHVDCAVIILVVVNGEPLSNQPANTDSSSLHLSKPDPNSKTAKHMAASLN